MTSVVDIPPRKLLARRFNLDHNYDMFSDTLLRKFLPHNAGDDDDDDDPYASDHFRMFEFKVRRCTRSRSHDWTDCPFAHPGEKARRRDPRRYHYSGTVCSEYRRGACNRGDNCEFSHGVFECWLHPARYRTEACKDGKNCKRKVCFFAHSARELRVLPPLHSQTYSPEISTGKQYRNFSLGCSTNNHCCMYCQSALASPTSTLLGMSHLSPPLSPSQSLSPPLSPLKHRSVSGFSPISRYSDRFLGSDTQLSDMAGYKDALTPLMRSLEAMNVNEGTAASASASASASHLSVDKKNLPWIDVPYNCDDQEHFILSPTTPNSSLSRDFFHSNSSIKRFANNTSKFNDTTWCSADPDLGWVNDLLT